MKGNGYIEKPFDPPRFLAHFGGFSCDDRWPARWLASFPMVGKKFSNGWKNDGVRRCARVGCKEMKELWKNVVDNCPYTPYGRRQIERQKMHGNQRSPEKRNFNVWMTDEEKDLLREVAEMLGVDMGTACKLGVQELKKKFQQKRKDTDGKNGN